jgi:exodeoxyribonuclease V gamma subunit
MQAGGFHLVSSNRLDALAAHLAERLARPVAADAPLAPDTILIPQPTLRRWLQSWLARKLGIAANLRFLTPSEFTWELLRADSPGLPDVSPWDGARLRWRLYALLDADAPAEVAAHLRRAAGASGDGAARDLARWRLAESLASAFDRYQAYRRPWLEAWERGEAPDDWQAALWRRLLPDGPRHDGSGPPRSRLLGDWLRRYGEAGAGTPPGLPARLTAFATMHVSPDVLRLLAVCAQSIELDFHRPTPSAAYWGDVEALRTVLHRDGTQALPDALAAAQHDNPLLQAWGAAGREFDAQLFAYDLVQPATETDLYAAPARDTLLHALQADTFERAAPRALAALDDRDQSLQVHACHSRLREVEVLHDRLRAMLDPATPDGARFDPPLKPNEIAVLAPNIGDYLPLARAVFGGIAAGDPLHIPYTLSDRPQAQAHPLVGLFLSLLELRDARRTASEVRDLLAVPQVLAAFGLSESDLDRLGDWFAAAGIAWGEDEVQREALGVGRWREHSFAFGLDRLLLGYATGEGSDDIGTPGGGLIAPCTVAEGGDAERLDALVALLSRLHRLSAWLREDHDAAAWRDRLAAEFKALLPPVARDDAEQAARRIVTETLDAFVKQASDAGPLALDVVRAALGDALQAPSPHQPFLGGGVTFAGMVPLRTIPFRVICLLGMDAEAFPRREPPGDINRLAGEAARGARRLGDRSVREDDRFLFLQLLAAAGDTFYASYGGRDARDGSVREPSALVSELLDVAQRYLPAGMDARERLVLSHPLQPFSPQAFGTLAPGETVARRFSYRASWRQPSAQRVLRAPPPFVAAPLPALPSTNGESPATLALGELQAFLRNPPRGFLRGRLDLALPYRDDAREHDSEPQGDNALLRHTLVTALVQDARDDAALRARGLLPPGHEGGAFAAEARGRAAMLRDAIQAWRGDAPGERIAHAIALPGLVLDARVPDVHGGLRAVALAGGLKGKHWLRALVEHLALAAALGETARTRVFWLEKNRDGALEPREREMPALHAAAATARLADLADLWREGQSRPLPFAADAAFSWCETFREKNDEDAAWKAALATFDDRNGFGAGHDAWFRLAFRPLGMLAARDSAHGTDFARLAWRVFEGGGA